MALTARNNLCLHAGAAVRRHAAWRRRNVGVAFHVAECIAQCVVFQFAAVARTVVGFSDRKTAAERAPRRLVKRGGQRLAVPDRPAASVRSAPFAAMQQGTEHVTGRVPSRSN